MVTSPPWVTSKVSAMPAGAVGKCAGHSVSLPETEEEIGREQELGLHCHLAITSCLRGVCGVAGGEGWWRFGVTNHPQSRRFRSMASTVGEQSGVDPES